MKLNIYEGKKVVKTYTADSYDILWGTVQDVASVVEIDSIKTLQYVDVVAAILKLIFAKPDEFNRLLKDVFDGLTDEELRKVKFKEIAWVMADIVKYTAEQFGKGSNEKN